MKKNRIRYWDHKRKKTVKKEIMGRKKEWERKEKEKVNRIKGKTESRKHLTFKVRNK